MERIILFGVGNKERSIAAYLIQKLDNVIKAVDNNPQKWGLAFAELFTIEKPETILNCDDGKTTVVIATYNFHEEIKEQLRVMGWKGKVSIALHDYSFLKSFEYEIYRLNINADRPEPQLLALELSGFCNCKCSYCPFHGETNIKKGHKGLMQWSTLKQIVQQLKGVSSIKMLSICAPGEVFMNPEWFEMTQYVLKELSILSLSMYTNGMLLNKENVKKIGALDCPEIQIDISIDGRSPEENDQFRLGSKYQTVRSNLKFANQYLKSGEINDKTIEILITNCYPTTREKVEQNNFSIDNVNEVPEFLLMDFPEIASVSQKTYAYGNDTYYKKLIAEKKIEKVTWPQDSQMRCLNLFYRLPINYKGDLITCSCGYAVLDVIGNIFEDNVAEIWKSNEKLNKARNQFIEGRKNQVIELCKGCPSIRMGEYYVFVD